MMAELLVIDGDNVAHRLPGVAEDRRRETLIALVSSYCEAGGLEAMVVLDGHGADFTIGQVAIRHAGDHDADTVIERMAHRLAAEHEVTVVSSDAALRHVAARGGVHGMSAGELVARLSAPQPAPRVDQSRRRYRLGDALDPATRAVFEQIRRGLGGDP